LAKLGSEFNLNWIKTKTRKEYSGDNNEIKKKD